MQNQSVKKYKFIVSGMHCKACEYLINDELKTIPNVSGVSASLSQGNVEVTGDFGDFSDEQVAQVLSHKVNNRGYDIGVNKIPSAPSYKDFRYALPIALFFTAIFIALQKVGLINLIDGSNGVTMGTAFVIGAVASLSTCMAVVGGLLLSMSTTFAKAGDRIKPQVLFHVGRLVAFFVLGGVIGSIGSAFTLSIEWNFVLSILIGLVMLVLGINLLDIFPWTKKFMPSMPGFFVKYAHQFKSTNHFLTPVLVGILTFFLPCGFTQSMQLYTLSTGDFMSGALTMTSFALGTLPVLSLISFSSLSIKNSSRSGVFFKTAGIIVIMFAILNILNSLVITGIIPPLFEI